MNFSSASKALRAEWLKTLKNTDPKLAQAVQAIEVGWFKIRNKEDDATKAEVFIYGEIGGWFGDVSADDLVKELNGIKGSKLEVHINSPGGSVFDGLAIYNALNRHPSDVVVYVDALAASAASVIALGGDELVMMRGSQLMIHDAMGIELGNAADMRAMAAFLDKQSDNIASIYAEKAGGEIAEWRNRMLAETWMFADEAIELGLADRTFTRGELEQEKEGEGTEDEEKEDDTEVDAEEGDDEESDDDDGPLDQLMSLRYDLSRFQYSGRTDAPSPLAHTASLATILRDTVHATKER